MLIKLFILWLRWYYSHQSFINIWQNSCIYHHIRLNYHLESLLQSTNMLIIDYNIQDITEHVFDLILPLSPFFCRHYSKLMIRSPPILLSSTLEITTNSYSVELQKNDTILTPPPILYMHTTWVNNTVRIVYKKYFEHDDDTKVIIPNHSL